MESSDSEEVYDVERILAEKTEDNTVKYLVKWQGYPDEQCTWEPAEHFNTTDSLKLWTKQKNDGDILDNHEVQRLQAQMDAFQAGEGEDENDNKGQSSSEGQSDVDLNTIDQPPQKRLKTV